MCVAREDKGSARGRGKILEANGKADPPLSQGHLIYVS